MTVHLKWSAGTFPIAAALLMLSAFNGNAQTSAVTTELLYEHEETRALVTLVDHAASLVRSRGENSFVDFRVSGSRWRKGESYVFVLDPDGNMLVHADPAMEGANQLGLKDVAGKPIVRGLIEAATTLPDKPAGWYHYQWPVPGGLLPRWKSSYVRLVEAPSGSRYIVGSGVYNDRMEGAFVVDMVTDAVARIEKDGEAAYPRFFDRTGPFLAKDAYVWVVSSEGVDLANPAFPGFKGRNQLDLEDADGKPLIREMLDVVQTRGAGRDRVVSRGRSHTGRPEAQRPRRRPAARGKDAFGELRDRKGPFVSMDTYVFVDTPDGVELVNSAQPSLEGTNLTGRTDLNGKAVVDEYIGAAMKDGSAWVECYWYKPGHNTPALKRTFVRKVQSGPDTYIVGSGFYVDRESATIDEP